MKFKERGIRAYIHQVDTTRLLINDDVAPCLQDV